MHLTNEDDLRSTVLNAPIGICILNADTFVAELLNDKFLEIAGKPREDIIGHWYWKPFAEAKDFYEQALIDVVKTGTAFYADEVELMLVRHGKEEHIFVTFVYAPVTDANGNVRKVAVWVLENTRQVKARQEIDGLNKKLAEANQELQTANISLTELNTRLQESETDFKRMVEQAPVAILVFRGPDLVIDQANQAMLELLGKDPSIIGRPLLQGLPEIEGAPAVDQLFHVFNTGEPSDGIEQPVPIERNGKLELRYFNFSYRPLFDNGKIIGVMDVAVEVTAQVLAREQANEQKRVYETITSGTPDLMYVWDLDYNFTYVNSALLTMWGKTWDTAVGQGLRENGYEEWHAQMHEREIDHVVATKESVRGEVSFPHAILGKRIYDYILIPVLGDEGEVIAVAGTTRDVTERKQMEEALAASQDELQATNEELAATNEEQAASNEELMATNEELALVNQSLAVAQNKIEENQIALRLAIEAANFGSWFIHSETREFKTDARLKELFGYYPDEDITIEQAIAQITDEYRGFVSAKLENAIYNGGDYDVTYPVTGLHDNRLRWLRAIGNLKADPSGTFSAFTGVVMDVTEQRANEQRKNDFIGMVSHELRTPLTSLTAIIQLAHSKLKNSQDPFIAGAMERAGAQVKRMNSMINGFLNVSRLESSKITIDKSNFDIHALVREVVDELRLTTNSHEIDLVQSEGLEVFADREKINSVISNLLSNAIKYSPKGTSVHVSASVDTSWVTIGIKDSGIGINPEDLNKIFERYYRVENDQTPHISGFGIGLYLSSEIIQLHRGRIWVESDPGKGSTFYFSLPL